MSAHAVTVQACGCISQRNAVMSMLRVGLAAEFTLFINAEERSLMLRVISPPVGEAGHVARLACPVVETA